MSTVRTARTRFSGVAKRARNSAAASRIAAGRSPRGQVSFAWSNSWNGRSPIFSILTLGTSTTAIACLPPHGRFSAPRRHRYRHSGRCSKQNSSDGPRRPIGRTMPRVARLGGVSHRLAVLVAAAATIVALAGGTVASTARAGIEPHLLPDLVTMKVTQGDLAVEHSGGKLLLRLPNEIGNKGRGPLEIYPSASSNNCDGDGHPSNDRDVYQRIFLDSNGNRVFDRAQDT